MKNLLLRIYKSILYTSFKEDIKNIEKLISEFESMGWTDEQEFLDLENKLNELSIKDHNPKLD